MPDSPERIKHTPDRSGTFEHRTDKDARKFYQTYKWQKFRGKVKKQRRFQDKKRVHDLYKQMPNTAFSSYSRWLRSDNPLCVDCLDEGYIRDGVVADHKKRIRDGGEPFDPNNIEFRCQTHHNKKSGKEAHE